MEGKLFLILETLLMLFGMFTLQACYSEPAYYGSGYHGPPPGTAV